LRVGNPIFREVGVYAGLGLAFVVLIGFVTHRRGTAKERLTRRRDELLAMLEKTAGKDGDATQRQRILSALDRVYRQLDALEQMHAKSEPGPKPKHVEE
jgi:hypothetical protein